MNIRTPLSATAALQYFNPYHVEAMERDKLQSGLLREPRFRIMRSDPISCLDLEDYMSHCSLLDGNLTIYFETEANCLAYKAIPFDHPNLHLPFPADVDDDCGG